MNKMPVKKCSSCHDPEKKQENADKLNLAFHKNCQTCHKELKGKEAPWKKCADCHASGLRRFYLLDSRKIDVSRQ
jgi:hypothetical protein